MLVGAESEQSVPTLLPHVRGSRPTMHPSASDLNLSDDLAQAVQILSYCIADAAGSIAGGWLLLPGRQATPWTVVILIIPIIALVYIYINILHGQRIGAVLNSWRANAPSFIAYFPVRATATALSNLYASIIAFPGSFRTNASPVTAYSALLAAVAGG
jgi:hypothetical protein